jgi:hypothetical protein
LARWREASALAKRIRKPKARTTGRGTNFSKEETSWSRQLDFSSI